MEQHLLSRFFDYRKHRCYIGDDLTVFPLWNLMGQMVGYHQYRPDKDKTRNNDRHNGRYFTYYRDILAVWGMESFSWSETLFVTEGIFDASRMTWNNRSAVCIFSCNMNDYQKDFIRLMQKIRPVVFICDNDTTGKILSKYGDHYFVESGKDLGDATEDEVQIILKRYG